MGTIPFIVIADDNPTDVFLVRSALKRQGLVFELRVLSDGGEALAFLAALETNAEPCPDILLLDLNLPKYSGVEILERLRHSTRCRGLSVVVITSSNSPRDRESVARFGITAYFLKSTDLDEYMKIGNLVKAALEDLTILPLVLAPRRS